MSVIKKSHNDYWAEPQILRAIAHDCRIMEIDVIYLRGWAMLSHSWRPFFFLTYGMVKKYFSFFDKYSGPDKLYLLVDIKTSNRDIVPVLERFIMSCENKYVDFLIRFDENNDRRREVATELFQRVEQSGKVFIYHRWVHFMKQDGYIIETINLYKGLPLWKRLNHF